jgi:hypothetical protein
VTGRSSNIPLVGRRCPLPHTLRAATAQMAGVSCGHFHCTARGVREEALLKATFVALVIAVAILVGLSAVGA